MSLYSKALLALALVGASSSVHAQLDSRMVIPNLKKHISTLASDAYQGRETGEPGERMSYMYILKEFKDVGLAPLGTSYYLQAFPFTKSVSAGPATKLNIDGKIIEKGDDFFPLAFTINGKVNAEAIRVGYGMVAPKLEYNDYKDLKGLKGKIFIIETSTPDKGGPHSKYSEYTDFRMRIDTAISRGAAGVIFINSDKDAENPKADYTNRITPSTIPVAFVGDAFRNLLMKDGKMKVELQTELVKKEGTGYNVLGYMNNFAPRTIVIGAHYDHLGMGGEGSLYRGEPAIHNGADDNASGTAALIELARYLITKGPKNNNYLFMAYSGEEKGLLGSSFWVKNPTQSLDSINYMLNMDMVGRLKPEDPQLLVNGTGTSDAWKITMNYIKVDSLRIKTTESGVGPSDHTSFYLKGIPVLHFFSGTHNDYHKPSDDENLINYTGEISIMNYMIKLIQSLDDKGKLTFQKTKDDTNEEAPRFKVTLGVVPDYGFDGEGMRIDGITEGRPASKAGLKSGDIVTAIGEHKVLDMMSYMKALGAYAKGDKADVTVKRGTEQLKVNVEF